MFLRWPSEVADVADVRREAIDACGAMDEVGRTQEPLRRMGVDELRCISARCGPRLGPARRHRVGTVPGLELLGRKLQNGGQSQHHLVRSGPKTMSKLYTIKNINFTSKNK